MRNGCRGRSLIHYFPGNFAQTQPFLTAHPYAAEDEGTTHTGEGGPVPPTGNRVEADYVYVMDFDGDRIRHMTKIWNDGISLTQLGWM